MKKSNAFISKVLCLMVTLGMTLGLLPVSGIKASTTSTSKADEIKFVFAIDVSSTMSSSDPHGYGKDSIEMFLDMLPKDNASVGLAYFGPKNTGQAYSYSSGLAPSSSTHKNYVRKAYDVTKISNGKEKIKDAVRALPSRGEQTLIDAGLLAGIDMLTKADTDADKGCVILITDGQYKSYDDNSSNQTDLDKAKKELNKNGWSVYCLELDYADKAHKDSNHKYLTGITKDCNGDTFQAASAEDVSTAFMQIINSYYDNGNAVDSGVTDDTGYGNYNFSVPDLTSESNITVTSNSLKGVELMKGDKVVASFGENEKYSKNDFEFEKGKFYYNIKMILPEAGDWTVKVHANAKTGFVINNISFADLVMVSTLDPESNTKETAMTKKEAIKAEVALTYSGNKIKKSSLGNAEAFIKVTNEETSEAYSFDMDWNDDTSQFEGSVPIGDLGKAGKLSVNTEVDFSGNVRKSKVVNLYTYNEPVTVTSGTDGIVDVDHYVNEEFEYPIEGLFNNPDDDALTFETNFEAGEDSDVSITLNEDKTALLISTGKCSGNFEGGLSAWDADMGRENAVSIPIKLTVQNHTMQVGKLKNVDMTAARDTHAMVDLTDLFVDEDHPEGVAFTLVDDYDEGIVQVEMSDNEMELTGKSTDKTTITLKAMDDDGKEYAASFDVEGTTQTAINKAILMEKIRNMGILGVILIILFVIAIIVFGTIKANTRIRGIWRINISSGLESYSFELNTNTDVPPSYIYKASLTNVIDLADLPMENAAVKLAQGVSSELSKIQVSGILRGNGCQLNLKSARGVKLLVEGQEVTKKTKLSYGKAEVIVNKSEKGDPVKVRIDIM